MFLLCWRGQKGSKVPQLAGLCPFHCVMCHNDERGTTGGDNSLFFYINFFQITPGLNTLIMISEERFQSLFIPTQYRQEAMRPTRSICLTWKRCIYSIAKSTQPQQQAGLHLPFEFKVNLQARSSSGTASCLKTFQAQVHNMGHLRQSLITLSQAEVVTSENHILHSGTERWTLMLARKWLKLAY